MMSERTNPDGSGGSDYSDGGDGSDHMDETINESYGSNVRPLHVEDAHSNLNSNPNSLHPNRNLLNYRLTQTALLSLLQGTEGKVWSSSHKGWSLDSLVPICEWEGISCRISMNGGGGVGGGGDANDTNGDGVLSGAKGPGGSSIITTLHLPNAGLSGTLPTELGYLQTLEEINLKGNLIRGSIPEEIAGLGKLTTLDLSDCLLTGVLPQWWASGGGGGKGGGGGLRRLILGNNGISGPFFHTPPTQSYSPHLSSLVEVSLERNMLTGTLHPATLHQMHHLETLSLSENDLSGLIPGRALGSLEQLKYLYLDNNQFVGPLPSQLAQVSREYWNHGSVHAGNPNSPNNPNNPNNPNVDATPTTPATATAQLLELWVQSNALSGTVPASYVRFDKLHDFFIDGNKLTGAIPLELCGPGLNSDFFDGSGESVGGVGTVENEGGGETAYGAAETIQGSDNESPNTPNTPNTPNSPNSPSSLSSVFQSHQERSYCEYIACPSGSTSLEGVYPCTPCPGGDGAKVQNPYLGHKGQCRDWTQREILRVFWEGASLNGDWRPTGRTGTTGMTDMTDTTDTTGTTGTTDTTNWNDWNTLNDSSSTTPTIPTCSLPGITCDSHQNILSLSLPSMNLAGTLAPELGFLPFLESLDLSHNDLTGYLPSDLRWTPLVRLEVAGNQLRGVVPPLVCRMEELNGNGRVEDLEDARLDGNGGSGGSGASEVFFCDRIACPSGTYNPFGRHVDEHELYEWYDAETYASYTPDQMTCLPCYDDSPYIAQTKCNNLQPPKGPSWHGGLGGLGGWGGGNSIFSNDNIGISGRLGITIALTVLGVAIGFGCWLKRGKQYSIRGRNVHVRVPKRRRYEQQKMLRGEGEDQEEEHSSEDGEYLSEEEDEEEHVDFVPSSNGVHPQGLQSNGGNNTLLVSSYSSEEKSSASSSSSNHDEFGGTVDFGDEDGSHSYGYDGPPRASQAPHPTYTDHYREKRRSSSSSRGLPGMPGMSGIPGIPGMPGIPGNNVKKAISERFARRADKTKPFTSRRSSEPDSPGGNPDLELSQMSQMSPGRDRASFTAPGAHGGHGGYGGPGGPGRGERMHFTQKKEDQWRHTDLLDVPAID